MEMEQALKPLASEAPSPGCPWELVQLRNVFSVACLATPATCRITLGMGETGHTALITTRA